MLAYTNKCAWLLQGFPGSQNIYSKQKYDMILYYMIYDTIWYDMIYLSTAIGLAPGGSSTVHI